MRPPRIITDGISGEENSCAGRRAIDVTATRREWHWRPVVEGDACSFMEGCLRWQKLKCVSRWLAVSAAAVLLTQCARVSQAEGPPQTAGQASPADPAQGKSHVREFRGLEGLIKLDVVVTDKAGRAVKGLGVQDFTVLEDGKPASIASFNAYDGMQAKADPSFALILVIDHVSLSGTLRSRLLDEVRAYLERDGGHLAQPAEIYTLTENGRLLLAGPSTDGNVLAAEQAQPRMPSTPCALALASPRETDSLSGHSFAPNLVALQCLGRIATLEKQKPGKKLLIWVGPGSGIGSGEDPVIVKDQRRLFDLIVWFSTLLREARISLVSASVGKAGAEQLSLADSERRVESAGKAGFSDLRRDVLAIQSGGGVAEAGQDLAGVIDRYANETSAFYTLSLDPQRADRLNEYHDLKVEMREPGLIARTNTGYYDQPFYVYQPNPAVRRVTVAELDSVLDAGAGKRDGDLARELAGLELTERLSSARLAAGLARMHGNKEQSALVALADMSAFLRPPAAEISAEPPPSAAEQQQMFALAAEYLNKTINGFPDLFGRRRMARYVASSRVDDDKRRMDFEPLRLSDSAEAEVLYRQGREVVESDTEKRGPHQAQDPNLTTYGVFGPSLEIMREMIADPGLMTWRRWEQDASGRRAVFSYRVPRAKSLYHIAACCLPDGEGRTGFDTLAGYEGEITLDAATGAILRLEMQADLKGFLPILRSDLMVAYGPVEIGGKTYICPVKSVSILTMRSVEQSSTWGEGFLTYGPYQTVLIDFVFDQYHMFRTTSRVLTGAPPPPQ